MQKLPLILAIIGIILLGVGVAYPYVIIYVDHTPPKIVSTTPADGQTYVSIDSYYFRAQDVESGISYMSIEIYVVAGPKVFEVTREWSAFPTDTYISAPISPAITTAGEYKAIFRVRNRLDSLTILIAYFDIYTQLQGKWYVAGTAITATTQAVYSTTTTIPFKFVKTVGITDESITCEVWEGTSKLLTLTNTAANTWEGSYTFAAGMHDLTLKAYDGTTTITFNIVGLDLPGGWPIIIITLQHIFISLGVVCLVTAAIIQIKTKP